MRTASSEPSRIDSYFSICWSMTCERSFRPEIVPCTRDRVWSSRRQMGSIRSSSLWRLRLALRYSCIALLWAPTMVLLMSSRIRATTGSPFEGICAMVSTAFTHAGGEGGTSVASR